jgi:hypothetical protein
LTYDVIHDNYFMKNNLPYKANLFVRRGRKEATLFRGKDGRAAEEQILDKFGFFVFRNSVQEEQISMTMDRLKHIHLVLTLGISLLIPTLLAYSAYVDLSGTVFLSSDIGFEDYGDEDLSTCQNEVKVFAIVVSSNSLLPCAYFGRMSSLFLSPLTSHTQNRPVLRC